MIDRLTEQKGYASTESGEADPQVYSRSREDFMPAIEELTRISTSGKREVGDGSMDMPVFPEPAFDPFSIVSGGALSSMTPENQRH